MNPPADHVICAVVPCYDHAGTVSGVVGTLRSQMPVIVVDDGSGDAARKEIASLADAYVEASGRHPVIVIRHEMNRGKGAAIVTGLRAAYLAGYSHALQVDADAQHDLGAASRFVETSRRRPDAFVLGYPVYDESIPLSRYYGRYLTHAWVWINSLSFAVKDSMCGFRVYPVDIVLGVIAGVRGRVTERMAFDIEICVRCARAGVAIVNEPVRVHYPADGKSHFRLWRDNAQISWMHARCFFSMLASIPGMWFGRAPAVVRDGQRQQAPERGSRAGMAILKTVLRFGGLGALRAALVPVVWYYVVADRAARNASMDYLSRLGRYCDARGIDYPMPMGIAGVYRHLYSFALSMAEKFRAWEGIGSSQVVLDAPEVSRQLVESPAGALLLVSHLGNFDIAIAHGAFATTRRYRILIDFHGTRRFNSERFGALLHNRITFHDVEKVGPEVAMELKQAVDEGEIVVIAADRVGRDLSAAVDAEFLGATARFPSGPWILAHLLKCPVYSVFVCREGRRYRMIARRVAERIDLSQRSDRDERLRELVEHYAESMESVLERYPEQWYNFYRFWNGDDE